MINANFNLASITGIVIAVAGAGLYALRSLRPEISKDHDLFFSAVGLLCGLILVFYGWRFDPIMQFGQVLLTGSVIFFAAENIKLRGITTKQAKVSTPIVDEERPVSRVYRAELDELPEVDERSVPRRLKGRQDSRNSRTTEGYDDTGRRRPSSKGVTDRLGQGDRPRKSRTRPESRPTERYDEWGNDNGSDDEWDSTSSVVRKPRRSNGSDTSDSVKRDSTTSRPKRSRPSEDSRSRPKPDLEETPTDYVDYKPIDYSDDDINNDSDNLE